jgi:hypothetical protein
MTAYTTYAQPATAIPRVEGGIGVVTSNVVDIGGTTAADTFTLFTIPTLHKPISCIIKVVEDAGETCTVDVGITGGDVDGLVDGADLNQAAGTIISGAGDDLALGVENAAATTYSVLGVTGSTYAAGQIQVTLVYATASV